MRRVDRVRQLIAARSPAAVATCAFALWSPSSLALEWVVFCPKDRGARELRRELSVAANRRTRCVGRLFR